MNNLYDNGEMVLGAIKNVKNYMCKNCDDYEEIKDIIEDLENYDEDTIVAINYDLGMGYSIDYWHNSTDLIKESELCGKDF